VSNSGIRFGRIRDYDQRAWPGIGVEQRVINLVDEPGELRVVVRRSIRPPSSGPLWGILV
jgi:hypothetical protein